MALRGKMLTTLFLLAIAIGVAAAGGRWPIAAAAAVLLAAWAGTTFPDVDQTLPLDHRSALTHSVLPAAFAAAKRRWWAVGAGLALGIGLHLSADLFPNDMRGFATVKLPGYGSIGASASYLWFAVNAGGALLLGGWLLAQVMAGRLAVIVLGSLAVFGVVYLLTTDGGWWALAMFGGAGALTLRKRKLA
jgi:hypothetical protein